MQKKLWAGVRLLHLTQGKGREEIKGEAKETHREREGHHESNKKKTQVRVKIPHFRGKVPLCSSYEVRLLPGRSPSHGVCLYKALYNTTDPPQQFHSPFLPQQLLQTPQNITSLAHAIVTAHEHNICSS